MTECIMIECNMCQCKFLTIYKKGKVVCPECGCTDEMDIIKKEVK
jgi:uncharacterized Zn finger protein (UPF0148 family)